MKQVLITGASSDIGIETCKKYLAEGFQVVGHYNHGQDGFFDLVDASPNLQSLQIDLSNTKMFEQALIANKTLLEKTDILINMAAVSQAKLFQKITAADIIGAMNVNLIAALLLMRDTTPGMIKRKWGRIVNIGSIGVKFGGGATSFCYALSKHSLEFLPEDYKSWAANNVFVNTLRIGVTDTKFHDNNPEKNMERRIEMIPAMLPIISPPINGTAFPKITCKTIPNARSATPASVNFFTHSITLSNILLSSKVSFLML